MGKWLIEKKKGALFPPSLPYYNCILFDPMYHPPVQFPPFPLLSSACNPCRVVYLCCEWVTPGGLTLAASHPDAVHPTTQAQHLQNLTAFDDWYTRTHARAQKTRQTQLLATYTKKGRG